MSEKRNEASFQDELQKLVQEKKELFLKWAEATADKDVVAFVESVNRAEEESTALFITIDSKNKEVQRLLKQKVEHQLEKMRLEEPPVPKRKPGSKQYQDEFRRTRVVANIPESLMDVFEQDRGRRGKNISQMFEYILHNFYREHPLEAGEN